MKAAYQTAISNVFQSLGSLATFTPASGPTVSCWVIYEQETDVEPAGQSGVVVVGKTLEYQRADIDREAARGETFTVDSVVYTVSHVLSNDSFTVTTVVE